VQAIYDQLIATTKTNEKIKILTQCNLKERNFLRLTHDPFILSNIKKIVYDDNIVGTESFDAAMTNFEILYTKLSSRLITGNKAKDEVKSFLESVIQKERHLFVKALKKDLKCNIGIKQINAAFGAAFGENYIKEFNIQLANTYKQEKKYKPKTWLASHKLDGLRCYYVYKRRPEFPDHVKSGRLYTRNGHEIIGFPDIVDECRALCIANKLNAIDGELYSHVIDFEEIQSIVITKKEIDETEKQSVQLNVFACDRDSFKNARDMVDFLSTMKNSQYLYFLNYDEVDNDYVKIIELHDLYVSRGYEGIMLRDPDEVHYNYKRSDILLKYKNFIEADFEIVEVQYGTEGKVLNRVNRFEIKGTYDGYNITAGVGSGLNDKKRAYYEILDKKGELVGQLVEIKFQNLTDDKTSLRFPRIKKLKLDR
jgi:ATP-dependent DNA ligase